MDEAEIQKLGAAELFQRLSILIDKVQRIDADVPDEEADPRIERLLEEGQLICKRLDPLVRERVRDDPAALAEWEDIIHSCDFLDEAAPAEDAPGQAP